EQVIVPVTESAEAVNDWILSIVDAYDSLDPKEIRENPRLGAIPIVTMQAGMVAATDPRLIDPAAPEDAGSKVNQMIERMMEIYHQGTDRKTAQVVFSDIRNTMDPQLIRELVDYLPFGSTDVEKNSFDLFEDIKRKLVERGVPPSEIWWP